MYNGKFINLILERSDLQLQMTLTFQILEDLYFTFFSKNTALILWGTTSNAIVTDRGDTVFWSLFQVSCPN